MGPCYPYNSVFLKLVSVHCTVHEWLLTEHAGPWYSFSMYVVTFDIDRHSHPTISIKSNAYMCAETSSNTLFGYSLGLGDSEILAQ